MPQSSATAQTLLPLLLDSLQDYALFMMDTRGMIVSWTPGVLRLLGYEETEFIGLDVAQIFNATDRHNGIPASELKRADTQGRTEEMRWHRRKDGSQFWASEQLIALRNDGGELRGFAKLLRDDTARKRMEDELRETRERLQTALDVGGIGTWVWDIPEDRVVADANLARFFNVSDEVAAGAPIANYIASIHADDVERVFSSITGAIADDISFSEDYRLIQKNGSSLWVEARGKVETDLHGYPFQLNGVVVDISARKKAEADFRLSEERYRTLFEAIDNGFCVLEMMYDEMAQPINYRFLEINPAFSSQTGLKDAIGKTALELVPDLDAYWFQTYGRVAKTGEPVRFEQWAEAMGRHFAVDAFRVGPPEQHRVALLFTDITDRKRSEETMRQAHLQLEETNRLKDEFLATLSHELRTPLNSILGWANILRMNELDVPTQKKGLETIERNARAQAQLINDLLDVSRILTGKMRMELQPIELADVVENSIRNVLPAIEAKQIVLQTEIDRSVGFIAADADRLGQVFWNLLSNAIKFTPREGLLQVKMHQVNSQVEVQISDSGKGIEPAFLPYVFERFRQADASSTRSYGGLGIGLALVRHLMEAHGGTVRAHSLGENKGSTFSVAFPLQAVRIMPDEVETQSAPEQEMALLDASSQLPLLLGLRVLVVDDEPDARDVLELTLKKRGAVVVTAGSAGEAFGHFETGRQSAEPFDVLISDVGMPEENGYSLIHRIRATESAGTGFLPAIALTAYASHKDRMDSLLAGFQVHVTKPVESHELVATVASLMGRTGHAD